MIMSNWSRILDRVKTHIREIEREFASICFGKSERTIEYEFILRNLGPFNQIVLEVGCTGSSLAYQLAKMGYEVYAVDPRPYPFESPKLKFYNRDINNIGFPKNFFDKIILVSTIEHIGLGHYDDSYYENGDIGTMETLYRILKNGGKILLTTPYTGKHTIIPRYERYYDELRLNRLTQGFVKEIEEFYIPTRRVGKFGFKWINTTEEIASSNVYKRFYDHATVCLVLLKV